MLNPLASRRIIASLCATVGLVLGVQGSNGQPAVEKGKIYWTNAGYGTQIQRADLDSSNVEDLVTGLFSPSIALDIPQPAPTLVSTHNTVPPTTSRLEPNYPNPFNSTTQISYRLATPGPVRLDIYNILGQQVHTLVDQVQAAGFYQAPLERPRSARRCGSDGDLSRALALPRRRADATAALAQVVAKCAKNSINIQPYSL